MPRKRNSVWSERPRAPVPYSLLEGPSFRAISAPARQVFWRLVCEYGRHRGGHNGKLPCLYTDFETYGVWSDAIARSIRELVAVGLVEITRKGVAGNAEQRRPALYRITCFPAAGSESMDGTHDYERIKTLAEAKALVKAAHAPISFRDVKNGHRSKPAKMQNFAPGFRGDTAPGFRGENDEIPPPDSGVQSPPPDSGVHSTFRVKRGQNTDRRGGRGVGQSTASDTPASTVATDAADPEFRSLGDALRSLGAKLAAK